MTKFEQSAKPAQASNCPDELVAQIRIARATELAQAGKLLEAVALLTVNGELPDNARELDLLARIAARQGRFEHARGLWNAAIQNNPENQIYRQCIEQLTLVRRIERLMVNSQDILLNIAAWITIAFGIGVLVYNFWFQ